MAEIPFNPQNIFVPGTYAPDLSRLASLDGNSQNISTTDIENASADPLCEQNFFLPEFQQLLCPASLQPPLLFLDPDQRLEAIQEALTPPPIDTGYPEILSLNNPIRSLIQIESQLDSCTEADIEGLYQFIATTQYEVENDLWEHPDLTDQEKIEFVYNTIFKQGISYSGDQGLDFTLYESAKRLLFDCDTLSQIVKAIAFEQGWPVSLVKIPGHAFLRWNDGKSQYFNIDSVIDENESFQVIFPEDNEYPITHPDSFFCISRNLCFHSLNPADEVALSYYNRGSERLRQGIKSEPLTLQALQDFQTATFLNPLDADYYFGQAQTYLQLNHPERAITPFFDAIQLDPEFANAHYMLAKSLIEIQKYDKALPFSMNALALNINDNGARLQLTEIFIRSERLDLAYPHLLLLITLPAYRDVLRSLFSLVSDTPSNRYYMDVLSWTPNITQAHATLAKELIEQGRNNDALAHLNEVLQLDPYDSEARWRRGNILYETGHAQEALNDFDRLVLDTSFNKPEMFYYKYALLLHEIGRDEEALRNIEAALQLNPNSIGAHFYYATILADNDDFDQALIHIEEVLRLDPKDQDATCHE